MSTLVDVFPIRRLTRVRVSGCLSLRDIPHRRIIFTIPKMLRVFFKFKRKLLGDLCRGDGRSILEGAGPLGDECPLQVVDAPVRDGMLREEGDDANRAAAGRIAAVEIPLSTTSLTIGRKLPSSFREIVNQRGRSTRRMETDRDHSKSEEPCRGVKPSAGNTSGVWLFAAPCNRLSKKDFPREVGILIETHQDRTAELHFEACG